MEQEMHSDSDAAAGTNNNASPRFQPVTERHLQQLRLICGEERVRGPWGLDGGVRGRKRQRTLLANP